MLAEVEKTYHYIADDAELAKYCERWSDKEALALDTEFVRTNTFYPKLGLIQLCDGEHCYLIDPLAIRQWQPFKDLLTNPDCEIILHSASEDLNLLLTTFGWVPARLFDTQIAAGFLNYGFSLSYQALVESVLSIQVEKDETRSDWLQRPLSATQLRYAVNDVLYLFSVREKLAEQLKAQDKWQWFAGECEQIKNQALEFENPAAWAGFYGNISNAWQLNDKGLAYLQRLCVWREQEARRRNKPRNWVARDNDLQSLAYTLAGTEEEPSEQLLGEARGVPSSLVKRNSRSLLQALGSEDLSAPAADRARINAPLEPGQRKLLKQIQRLAREKAEELEMAPELLLKKRQIINLLSSWPPALNWQGDLAGWRRTVLGEAIESLASVDTSNESSDEKSGDSSAD